MVDQESRTWSRAQTQAFFAERAAQWETKYGHDIPLYFEAAQRTGPAPGGAVIDVGCGTGRAMPALREAVGPSGLVIGFDVTVEMVEMARRLGREEYGALMLADAHGLPLRTASVDLVFAAGLLGHVGEVDPVLGELARVTRTGGRLTLFHPVSRAALAARRGRVLTPEDILAAGPLTRSLTRAGWRLDEYDDASDRFYTSATRV